MIFDPENPPPCSRERDLFYSPEEDGRQEVGRIEREALAGIICATECMFRIECLETALVRGEAFGVWGGLGEGERRKFIEHLRYEGYDRGEIPEGKELKSCLVSFYVYMETADERFHGMLELEETMLQSA